MGASRVRSGRVLLALILTGLLMACAMGDIFNGPLPVDVTDEQVIGTWTGHDNAGTFVFAAGGTLTATDLPADIRSADPGSPVWSASGQWSITSPLGGQDSQRNIVRLDFDPLAGDTGGYGTRMSASRPEDVIVLTLGNHRYTKA